MGKIIDLTGKKYNRLTVVSFDFKKGTNYNWNCICDCGNSISVRSNSLKDGNTKSCGCLYNESRKTINLKHGEANNSKEYKAWLSMKRRCLDSNDKRYHDYGGRGIIICHQWVNSYETFLKDIGRAPSIKHSLDRIKVNGNYNPRNCKWSTVIEQQNNMRSNVIITYNDKTQTLAQWCRELGLKYGTIRTRLSRGWSIQDSFEI